MPIKTVPLTPNGPPVPALSIGLMSIGGAYGFGGTDTERLSFLTSLHAMGETFWDDADIYGDSEEIVGQWFEANPDKRKDIFLATKFGFVDKTGMGGVRSDPEYIRMAVERSLKNLKTDYIDLYYCHRPDDKTPIEVTVRTMAELQKSGKIRHIGLSEITPADLLRATKVAQITALQSEYSPWALEPETLGLLDICAAHNITFIAYSPLGRGFLTGKIRKASDVKEDARSWFPRFQEQNFAKNFAVVESLEAIAERKGCKVGQLGLAWLIKQGEKKGCKVIPVFGTRNVERVKENLQALEVELTEEENAEIRRVVDEAGKDGYGGRYPEMMEHLQLRETPKET